MAWNACCHHAIVSAVNICVLEQSPLTAPEEARGARSLPLSPFVSAPHFLVSREALGLWEMDMSAHPCHTWGVLVAPTLGAGKGSGQLWASLRSSGLCFPGTVHPDNKCQCLDSMWPARCERAEDLGPEGALQRLSPGSPRDWTACSLEPGLQAADHWL